MQDTVADDHYRRWRIKNRKGKMISPPPATPTHLSLPLIGKNTATLLARPAGGRSRGRSRERPNRHVTLLEFIWRNRLAYSLSEVLVATVSRDRFANRLHVERGVLWVTITRRPLCPLPLTLQFSLRCIKKGGATCPMRHMGITGARLGTMGQSESEL